MKNYFLPTKLANLIMLVALLVLSNCSATPNSSDTTNRVIHKEKVILLRGLANIFSRGMDVIDNKLKAKGINTKIYNHSGWRHVAASIVERYKKQRSPYPIIIAGHSLGANAAVQMASYLGRRNVPVSLVIAFDPTIITFVGPGVKKVINYYLPNGRNKVQPARGFQGKISNINISDIDGIQHITVEKNRELQKQAIHSIIQLVRK